MSVETNTKTTKRKPACAEKQSMFDNDDIIEIGIDEAGRGPLFGRVYVAAVALPLHSSSFPYDLMKDSKKFTSEKKLEAVAMEIMEKSIAYSVKFAEHNEIDNENILRITMRLMSEASESVRHATKDLNKEYHLLVDGNYYRPKVTLLPNGDVYTDEYTCVEGGDAMYASIAAASILAKYHRDKYIYDMCDHYPSLDEIYGLRRNKGYGTAKHMQAVREYGRSQWHRVSFNPCRTAKLITIAQEDKSE